MKKLLAIVLGIILSLSCVACGAGGGENYGNKLVIRAMINQSGIGTAWLENSAARYEELVANKQFGDKVGVKFVIDAKATPDSDLSSTSAYDIVTPNGDLFSISQQGLLMDLTELYNRESAYDDSPIIDRLSEEVKPYYQDISGKFYALPHYQYQNSITYNRDVFDEGLFYFAADVANGTVITTDYGTAIFVNSLDSKKSNGPDCKPNTYDDGLPSSVEELIILCQVMKENGVEPFQLSGKYPNYCNALNSALCASLAGYDQLQAFWELNGGEVEVIGETLGATNDANTLAYSNENAFTGIDYIKKPASTSKINMTIDNGFRIQDMAAKYYAGAFVEIAEKEGFFSADSYIDTVTHIGAQENFLLGDKMGGMAKAFYIDGTFWYNETLYAGTDDVLDMAGFDIKDIDVRPMPLPMYVTNADRDADQANWASNTNTVASAAIATLVVQKQVEKDTVKKEAIFDFLDFLYSTEEREKFTQETGLISGMEYDIDIDALAQAKGKYSAALFEYLNNSNLVLQISSKTFLKVNRASFKMDIFAGDTWWVNSFDNCYITSMRNGKNIVQLIENTRIASSQWEALRETFDNMGLEN